MAAPLTYSFSLAHLRLKPRSRTVAAPLTYSCSLAHPLLYGLLGLLQAQGSTAMGVCGGVIPTQDYEALHSAGVAAVFGPGHCCTLLVASADYF